MENTINRSAVGTTEQESLRNELCNPDNLTSFSDGTVGNRNDLANHQKAVEGDIPKTKFANIPEADTLTKLRNELLSCDPLFTIACDGEVTNALHDFSADSKDVVFDIPKTRDY